MAKGNFVHPQEIIDKAKQLVRVYGHKEPTPPDDDPVPLRTPADGVGGFHVAFGGEYGPTRRATYVKILLGGKQADDTVHGGDLVFEGVFFAGREVDPHKLFCKFDPDNDWRRDFLSLNYLKPDAEEQ